MSIQRGRPSGQMTPLRRKALAMMQSDVREGRAVIVAAVARRLGVDRRSARRIIADVRGMGAETA